MPRAAPLTLACSLACLPCLAACGDDGSSTPPVDAPTDARVDAAIDAAVDGPTGPLTLTSAVLAEGAMFPRDYTCNGANRSPPLTWINAPVGTQSLAMVLTDTSNNLIHWVIYDIPATRGALPEDVDKVYLPPDVPGAKQTRSYNQQVTGYLGPCPPAIHTYRFTLYAVGVASLPGATETSTRPQVEALIQANDLGMATLTGMYAQP